MIFTHFPLKFLFFLVVSYLTAFDKEGSNCTLKLFYCSWPWIGRCVQLSILPFWMCLFTEQSLGSLQPIYPSSGLAMVWSGFISICGVCGSTLVTHKGSVLQKHMFKHMFNFQHIILSHRSHHRSETTRFLKVRLVLKHCLGLESESPAPHRSEPIMIFFSCLRK